MTKIKFRVLGKKWQVRIPSKKWYTKKHGDDSVAITLAYKRRIYLHPTGTDLETIRHELVHAYTAEMCLKSTHRIKGDDWEEIYAEMFAKRGREILDLADRLYSKVRSVLK